MEYHIAAVARLTNLSVDVIRSWERRYAIVQPRRDEAGLRLYSDDDVSRLTLARMATQLGHPIRTVAKMSNAQLEALADQHPREENGMHGAVVERVLEAMHGNDARLAEQILASAALLLPTRVLVLNVLAPVLREVGARWEHGRIAVWQEHLISMLIRTTAAALPRIASDGAPLLLATPPFDAHEFGVSLAAILASSRGRTAYNLGSRVPPEEVADAARRLKSAAVVIGMTQASTPETLALEYADALDAQLPAGMDIWLGGTLGARIAPLIASKRVRGVATLEDFERLC